MEIRTAVGGQDHEDLAAAPTPRGSRSRMLPGVAGALSRPLHGAGLAHWGGPAPGREAQEPVDVVGTGRPTPLPRRE